MNRDERGLSAGIVDFSTRRMTDEKADALNIPPSYRTFVAEERQYAFKIADQLPEGVVWFDEAQPWYFRELFSDPQKIQKLRRASFLVLSGSGMSAYKFQEHDASVTPEDRTYIERAEDVIRNQLGDGKWVLGICYGGQLAVHAVGGRLGRLPKNPYGNTVTEAGWLPHELTLKGRNDEVFGHLPDTFYASHFHSDFVAELPKSGTKVPTENGEIEVVRADVLATRNGYLDRDGLRNTDITYIHAAVIEFDNGARLYHIQPHPEMATPTRANFLTRKVKWLLEKEEEMGVEYARNALDVPDATADFSVAKVITRFVEAYREHMRQEVIQIATPAIVHTLRTYAID